MYRIYFLPHLEIYLKEMKNYQLKQIIAILISITSTCSKCMLACSSLKKGHQPYFMKSTNHVFRGYKFLFQSTFSFMFFKLNT